MPGHMRRLLAGVLGVVMCAGSASAQDRTSRFGIADNSFLVEEAFNQERGVFQNIFVWMRARPGEWEASFTQEWPLGGQRHQLSFKLPFGRAAGNREMGDVMLNYRWQAWGGKSGGLAFSPRLSAVFATSPTRRGSGTGWQMNLPVSREAGPVIFHGNFGATWLEERAPGAPAAEWTTTPFAAGSMIWAATSMFHPMLEVFAEWTENGAGARDRSVTYVPGFRTGWNAGDKQIVLGVALPITQANGARDVGALIYFSYELPFMKSR
jgi:hypothetical protein